MPRFKRTASESQQKKTDHLSFPKQRIWDLMSARFLSRGREVEPVAYLQLRHAEPRWRGYKALYWEPSLSALLRFEVEWLDWGSFWRWEVGLGLSDEFDVVEEGMTMEGFLKDEITMADEDEEEKQTTKIEKREGRFYAWDSIKTFSL